MKNFDELLEAVKPHPLRKVAVAVGEDSSVISAAMEANHHAAFLIQGVTGSGKTEVYLQALTRCLEHGRRGIVLVPEISLTPQTVQRFQARFPGRVAVLHSRLLPADGEARPSSARAARRKA